MSRSGCWLHDAMHVCMSKPRESPWVCKWRTWLDTSAVRRHIVSSMLRSRQARPQKSYFLPVAQNWPGKVLPAKSRVLMPSGNCSWYIRLCNIMITSYWRLQYYNWILSCFHTIIGNPAVSHSRCLESVQQNVAMARRSSVKHWIVRPYISIPHYCNAQPLQLPVLSSVLKVLQLSSITSINGTKSSRLQVDNVSSNKGLDFIDTWFLVQNIIYGLASGWYDPLFMLPYLAWSCHVLPVDQASTRKLYIAFRSVCCK